MEIDLIKNNIDEPEIPEDWDFEIANQNFDDLILGWRRLTLDVVKILWVFYNKLSQHGGDRGNQYTGGKSPNGDLPTWLDWLKSKGIGMNTPLRHFRKLGWLSPESKEKEIEDIDTEHECPKCGYEW